MWIVPKIWCPASYTKDIYYSFPTEDFSPSSKSDISDRNQKISALGKPKYTQPWSKTPKDIKSKNARTPCHPVIVNFSLPLILNATLKISQIIFIIFENCSQYLLQTVFLGSLLEYCLEDCHIEKHGTGALYCITLWLELWAYDDLSDGRSKLHLGCVVQVLLTAWSAHSKMVRYVLLRHLRPELDGQDVEVLIVLSP
jgi:hypothetical protein